ncbi:MAG: hypothetical protein RL226_338 [Bacteroidota bacterium]|jgi:hypothetical protein
MKYVVLSLTFLCNLVAFSQWEATEAVQNNFDAIACIEEHNGQLFAATTNSGLLVLNTSTDTWEVVNFTGFTVSPIGTHITHLLDAGSALLAVTFNPIYASSMIYKSTDGGQSFIADGDGLPASSNNESVNIDHIYFYEGHLIVDVANLGFWHKPLNATTWEQNTHPSTLYSEEFCFRNARAFAWSEYHLFYTDDFGVNWSQCGDVGLPQWFVASMLFYDPISDRIYAAGTTVTPYEYYLLYTEDEGATWNTLSIQSVLSTNWLGADQTITSFFANGNEIWFSLDSPSQYAVADVFYSNDGGDTFVEDQEGLTADAIFSHAVDFATYSNHLYMALNAQDIFRRELDTGIEDNRSDLNVQVYPIPSTGPVVVSSNHPVQIAVYTSFGTLIATHPASIVHELHLPVCGIYTLVISESGVQIESKKILIN